MAFPNQQLFLDRFIARSKADYKDNPSFLERLNSLTLSDVTFSNLRKVSIPGGGVRHITDLEMPEVFVATDLQYLPGDFALHGVAALETTVVFLKDDLAMKTTPGIYLIFSADGLKKEGAILVGKGDKDQATVFNLIKTKSLFTLVDSELKVDAGVNKVTINSDTIVGSLTVIESKDPFNAIHDGTFKHDGTLTY